MTWFVQAVGRPRAVEAAVEKQFGDYAANLQEPEKSVVEAAGKLIRAAVADYPDNVAVSVKGNGNQMHPNYDHVSGERGAAVNALALTIEPIFGFVE
jgi:hypothetical protein